MLGIFQITTKPFKILIGFNREGFVPIMVIYENFNLLHKNILDKNYRRLFHVQPLQLCKLLIVDIKRFVTPELIGKCHKIG